MMVVVVPSTCVLTFIAAAALTRVQGLSADEDTLRRFAGILVSGLSVGFMLLLGALFLTFSWFMCDDSWTRYRGIRRRGSVIQD